MDEETTSIPYSWLKAVDPKVVELDSIPLFGNAPAFPWEGYSELLSNSLKIKNLRVEPGKTLWRTEEELLSGFSDDVHIQEILVPDLEENCYFVIANSDWTRIASWLIEETPPVSLEQFDQEIVRAIKTFAFTTALLKFGESNFDPTLSLQLGSQTEAPIISALSIDILITADGGPITCRLLLSKKFLDGWKKRFEHQKMDIPVNSELLKKLSVILHLEIGKELLTKDELEKLEVGDILLLNNLTIDPTTFAGNVTMSYNGIPRFQGTLAEGVLNVTSRVTAFKQLEPLQKPLQESEA